MRVKECYEACFRCLSDSIPRLFPWLFTMMRMSKGLAEIDVIRAPLDNTAVSGYK